MLTNNAQRREERKQVGAVKIDYLRSTCWTKTLPKQWNTTKTGKKIQDESFYRYVLRIGEKHG